MRVILLKDVENFGKKDEVKEVKPGYARNYLFPKGLAKLATKENMEKLKTKKEEETKKAAEELKKIQEKASAIDGQEVIIPVKVGEQNQLFESITIQKIFEELKKRDFNIKKSQIELPEPIQEIGTFPVKIKFKHNLEAEIDVVITEESS